MFKYLNLRGILRTEVLDRGIDYLCKISLRPSVAWIINSAQHVCVKFPQNHEQLSEVRSYLKRMFTEETDVFMDNTQDIQ